VRAYTDRSIGTLPYVASSATTVYLAHQAGLAAAGVITYIDPGVAHTLLDQALNIQVTYGAVILSFLGAIHWGMEFAGFSGQKGYARLGLGAAPVLFAWSTLALQPTSALIAQWAGFTGLWWADARVTSLGWSESTCLLRSSTHDLLAQSANVVFTIPFLLVDSRWHMYHRLPCSYFLLGPCCGSRSSLART
jgi:Protein of unknown function (DUF3429)